MKTLWNKFGPHQKTIFTLSCISAFISISMWAPDFFFYTLFIAMIVGYIAIVYVALLKCYRNE